MKISRLRYHQKEMNHFSKIKTRQRKQNQLEVKYNSRRVFLTAIIWMIMKTYLKITLKINNTSIFRRILIQASLEKLENHIFQMQIRKIYV